MHVKPHLGRVLPGIKIRLLFVFLLSTLSVGAIVLICGLPEPGTFEAGVEDEMSHVLLAETLAQGRLTNPPHPLWQHFETQYVLHQPTYTSKYPPALPLLMAAGKWLGGHYFYGIWLGLGLMCVAVTWMLHAWVPPRWAFLGGILFTLHLGIISDWTYYYSGGGIPTVIGAALLLGAMRRVIRRPTTRGGIFIGLGLMILSFGRPYEGMILALCVAVILAYWLFVDRSHKAAQKWRLVVVPIALLLATTAVMHGVYNQAVTGKVTELPYQRYVSHYREVPNIMITRPGEPPDTPHVVMKAKWQAEYDYFQYQRSVRGLMRATQSKVQAYWWFYIGPMLTIPLLMLLLTRWWRGWSLFAIVAGLAVIGAVCLNFAMQVHYPAPAAPLAIFLILMGLRRMNVFIRGRKGFLILAVAAIALELGYTVVRFIAYSNERGNPPLWVRQRLEVRDKLMATPGLDLVIVTCDAAFRPHQDIVFNEPNIDESPIVWARSISPEADAALKAYFKGRKIWHLPLNSEATTVIQPIPASE